MNNVASPAKVGLVVLDWAGTIVDHGSIAPIAALIAAFKELGLELSEAEARRPMGLEKRDHIGTILKSPEIASQWTKVFGSPPTAADRDALYDRFLPLQMRTATSRTALVPGVVACVRELRSRDIKIGTTTGYPREIGAAVADSAREQGFTPDHCVFPDDVGAGRPAPLMIFRNMELAGIEAPALVVKLGDTVPDIEEGRNAACWSIGLTDTGSEIGLDAEPWQALSATERGRLADAARAKLLAAGAHAVIPSIAQLPGLVDELNQRLGRGEQP
jgi:phosphonoacetaldehyde hydrolase